MRIGESVIYSDESALASIDAGEGGFIHMRTDGVTYEDGSERQCFVVNFFDSNGDFLYRDHDLQSPAYGEEPMLAGLQAILLFVLACAESESPDSENYSLFPDNVREWAETYSTELAMIHEEISEEIGH